MRSLFSLTATVLLTFVVVTPGWAAGCSVSKIPAKVVRYTNSNDNLTGQMQVSLNDRNKAVVQMTVYKNGQQVRSSTGQWHRAKNGSYEVSGGKILVTFYTGLSGKNQVEFSVGSNCQLNRPVHVYGINKGAIRFSD